MRGAVAGRTGATETKFCDEASDQLSDAIPRGYPRVIVEVGGGSW